jgi:phage-related holin
MVMIIATIVYIGINIPSKISKNSSSIDGRKENSGRRFF